MLGAALSLGPGLDSKEREAQRLEIDDGGCSHIGKREVLMPEVSAVMKVL